MVLQVNVDGKTIEVGNLYVYGVNLDTDETFDITKLMVLRALRKTRKRHLLISRIGAFKEPGILEESVTGYWEYI